MTGRGECPECGSPLVPTMRGLRCPKLGSCGRGGVEERRVPRARVASDGD